jgi:hydrogenase maturation protease
MDNLFDHTISQWTSMLIIGMGNRIKHDDGVGIYIADRLLKEGVKNVIMAENSIENYIGKINSYSAKALLMIDAVDQDEAPGFFQLLPLEEIKDTTTNTHNLSLDTIASFLTCDNIRILAIQPGTVSFGFGLSPEVRNAADRLTTQLIEAISKSHKISQL